MAGFPRKTRRASTPDLPARCFALEADIQRTVVEFLQLDGWRALRTEMTVQRDRGRATGESGMPDYLFIRYGQIVSAEVLWIEFKRAGKEPRTDQKLWHSVERKRGAMVLVVDDIDKFITEYKSSPLYRREREARNGIAKVENQRGVEAGRRGQEYRD